jgi:hypothetical protein
MGSRPATATPARRLGSVRRTTTHDSLRPDGLRGPVSVLARGRDLRTSPVGETDVVEAARVELRVSPREYSVASISAEPSHPGLAALTGVRVASGFRQAVDVALPGERTSRSVRFQLLDDLPTALLVSGYAVQAGALIGPTAMASTLERADLCSGWAVGATMMSAIRREAIMPTPRGPAAPFLRSAQDEDGWHEFGSLPPHGMRRHRRLDVWRQDGVAIAEGFFRDSHMNGGRVETVLHEYTVHAVFDPGTGRFLSCTADVGALPWPECPAAAASAARLAGAPADGLRGWVRGTFVGTTTCTHLNDTLRSLEDVGYLAGLVSEQPSAAGGEQE